MMYFLFGRRSCHSPTTRCPPPPPPRSPPPQWTSARLDYQLNSCRWPSLSEASASTHTHTYYTVYTVRFNSCWLKDNKLKQTTLTENSNEQSPSQTGISRFIMIWIFCIWKLEQIQDLMDLNWTGFRRVELPKHQLSFFMQKEKLFCVSSFVLKRFCCWDFEHHVWAALYLPPATV